MSVVDAIRGLAAEAAQALGLEVVEASFHRSPGGGALRVTIDRPGPPGVGIDDCQRFSGAFERLLDERDPIEESYVLEVSSPGLDRPIQTDDDVRRNTGRRVEVELREPVEGSRSFRGVLQGLRGDALLLRPDGGPEIELPRPLVMRARQEMELRPHEKRGKGRGRRGRA